MKSRGVEVLKRIFRSEELVEHVDWGVSPGMVIVHTIEGTDEAPPTHKVAYIPSLGRVSLTLSENRSDELIFRVTHIEDLS